MDDSYKIIISISHHRISFEYYLKGGDDSLVPMPPGSWPAPLAFYCSPTGIIVGEEASRAAQSGMANAFANYFDLLPQSNVFYEIGGERKPISKMLLDASETIFRDFYASVLLNRKGDLNDNRLNMPLTVVCEGDIKANERVYIKNTFKDSGYGRVHVESYDTYIDKYIKDILSKEYTCMHVLVVWTEGTDLCLTLFETKGSNKPVTKIFPGLGVDPRLNFVMNKIWENVSGQNPWLNFEEESPIIRKAALDFLNSSIPLLTDEIQLSDGNQYSYSLLRSNIDFIQSAESVALKKGVDKFLEDNSISDKGDVLLLLRSIAAGNSYFELNLRKGFLDVVRSDKELRNRTMKLIISSNNYVEIIADSQKEPEVKEPTGRDKRRYKELEMTVRTDIANGRREQASQSIDAFLSEMHQREIFAFDEKIKELRSLIHDRQTINKDEGSNGGKGGKKECYEPSAVDKRNFRIAKAEAKSALDNGDAKKAKQILLGFKDEMKSKRIEAFSEEIDALLELYSKGNETRGGNSGPKKPISTEPQRSVPSVGGTPPTPKDNRDFKILQKYVESKLAQGDKAAATKEIKLFVSKMHGKGVNAFDKAVKDLENKIRTNKY